MQYRFFFKCSQFSDSQSFIHFKHWCCPIESNFFNQVCAKCVQFVLFVSSIAYWGSIVARETREKERSVARSYSHLLPRTMIETAHVNECLVCSAPNTSLHFGIDACRYVFLRYAGHKQPLSSACTAFFKRATLLGRRYPCRKGQRKCEVARGSISIIPTFFASKVLFFEIIFLFGVWIYCVRIFKKHS